MEGTETSDSDTRLRVKQPQSACSFCKTRKIKVSTLPKRLGSSISIRHALYLDYTEVSLSVSDSVYSVMGRAQHVRRASNTVEQQAVLLGPNIKARIETM